MWGCHGGGGSPLNFAHSKCFFSSNITDVCWPMPWEFLTGLKNVLPQFGEKWQVLERKTTHIKKLCRVISSDSENVKLCSALQDFFFIFIDRQFLIQFLFRRGNILVLLLSEKKLGGLYFLSN